MIWFTSDTHYSHKNICKATSSWTGGYRDFNSLADMNDTLVDSINRNVQPQDTLYHLGDWSFGGYDRVKEFRDRINCRNIILVLGNHDYHILCDKKNELRKLFTKVYHGLWVGSIEKQLMSLCHYKMSVWDQSHHGAWCLFGHSHSSIPENMYEFSLEVGMDCVYSLYRDREEDVFIKSDSCGRVPKYFYGNNPENPTLLFYAQDFADKNNHILHKPFTPFSMDEIAGLMKFKKWTRKDHHNEETN